MRPKKETQIFDGDGEDGGFAVQDGDASCAVCVGRKDGRRSGG